MKKITLLIAIVLFAANVNGQTFHKRYYAGSGNFGYGFAFGFNGTILMAGCNDWSSAGSRDWQITRTDTSGNLLTSWEYNFTSDVYRCRVKQTIDSGYIAYGDNGRLLKLSSTGAIQWGKEMTGGGEITDLLVLADGNFIIASPSGLGFGLIKMDANGNIVWRKTTGGSSSTASVIINSSGNYVCTGAYGASPLNVAIAEFDVNGNVLWSQILIGLNNTYGVQVVQTPDNNYYVACWQNGQNYIVKLNPSGTFQWAKQTFMSYYAISLIALPNNNILYTYDDNSSPYAIYMNEMDVAGTNVYQYRVTATTTLYNYSSPAIMQAASGAIWVKGSCTGTSRFELIRMNSNYSGCSTALITTTTSGTSSFFTPSGGPGISTSTIPTTTNIAPVFSNTMTNVTSVCSVSALSASSSQTNPLCNAQCTGTATVTPSGGQAPYTYLWSPGGQTTPTKTNMCAGTYTCTVTDAGSSTTTVVVTITEPTAITSSTSATPTTVCAGNCSNLNVTPSGGTPGYNFSWSPAAGLSSATVFNPTACPTITTTYTCTITDANGCTQTGTVTVIVNPSPNLVVTGGGFVCEGTNVCFGSTGGLSYSWSGPCGFTSIQQNPCISSIGTSCGGTYFVTGTDVNGCSSTGTVTLVVNALPPVTYNETQTTTCVNWSPITLAVGSPSGGIYSGTAVTGNTFAPATAGAGTFTITYTYTDANACANSSASQIVVDLCTGTDQIPVSGFEFSVFPNPFNETITVQCDNLNGTANVELFNLLGEIVYSSVIEYHKTEIHLEGLQSGVYFVRINGNNGMSMKKIVKQ